MAGRPTCGEMPERPKGVDSKSTVPTLVPGVRIPLSPPHLPKFPPAAKIGNDLDKIAREVYSSDH